MTKLESKLPTLCVTVSVPDDCSGVGAAGSPAMQMLPARKELAGDRARAHCMIKRSVRFSNHFTSLSLEPEFWTALDALADAYCLSLSKIISLIDAKRHRSVSITSALRIFVLNNHVERKDFDATSGFRILLAKSDV